MGQGFIKSFLYRKASSAAVTYGKSSIPFAIILSECMFSMLLWIAVVKNPGTYQHHLLYHHNLDLYRWSYSLHLQVPAKHAKCFVIVKIVSSRILRLFDCNMLPVHNPDKVREISPRFKLFCYYKPFCFSWWSLKQRCFGL